MLPPALLKLCHCQHPPQGAHLTPTFHFPMLGISLAPTAKTVRYQSHTVFGDREGEQDGISSSVEHPPLEEISGQLLLPTSLCPAFCTQHCSNPSASSVAAAGTECSQQHLNCWKYLSLVNILFKHQIFKHSAFTLLRPAAHLGLLTVGCALRESCKQD